MVARLVCAVPNPSIDKTAEVGRLEPGAIHRPDALVAVPGGKGLNVARAASGLGVPVEAIVLLAGHAGRWMDDELGRRRILHRVVWATGETRTCLSILDRATGRMTEVYEAGDPVRPTAWRRFAREVERAAAALASGSLVAISGSFPEGVAADAAEALVQAAQGNGARALVDTSGEHLAAALEAHPFLVKLNATEAAAIVGGSIATEADALAAARELGNVASGLAVVTRGEQGAVGWDGRTGWVVDPPAERGPYVVGSGDAFLAGFAAALLAGRTFEDGLRLGAGAAAASTLVIGQGELHRAQAVRLARAAQVRPLDRPISRPG